MSQLAADHPIQRAWRMYVPQLVIVNPGKMMQVVVLVKEKPKSMDYDIDEAMRGKIRRAGTYQRHPGGDGDGWRRQSRGQSMSENRA